MDTEITGPALTEQRTLTVAIGRSKKPARTLANASRAYRNYLDEKDLGASAEPGCTVFDAAGAKVATVSYNGRVWAA
jgi:hypothetical protein